MNIVIKNKQTGLTTVEAESGRWLVYFDNSTNVISNGETHKEALDNLNAMLKSILNNGYNHCFSHPQFL